MTDPGKFRDPATIVTPIGNQTADADTLLDSGGGVQLADGDYVKYAEVFGDLRPKTVRESTAGGEIVGAADFEFETRYIPGVEDFMRLLFDDDDLRIFDLAGPPRDPDNLKHTMLLDLVEVRL